MKFIKTPLVLAGVLLGTRALFATLPVGRGEIGFTVTDDVTYDSNIFGTRAATGDFYNAFTPAISYARAAARIKLTASAGVSLLRYAEQENLDADNLNGSFLFRLDDGGDRKFSASVGGVYSESSDVNSDLNTRVRSKSTAFTAQASLLTGPRTNFAYNGTYNNVDRSVGSNQRTLNQDGVFHYNNFLGGYNLRLSGNYGEARSSGKTPLACRSTRLPTRPRPGWRNFSTRTCTSGSATGTGSWNVLPSRPPRATPGRLAPCSP